MEKIKSPATFIKAPVLLKNYDKYTDSNMPFSQIIKIGLNIRKFSMDNISTNTLPGYPKYKGRVSYFFNNPKQTKDLLDSIGVN